MLMDYAHIYPNAGIRYHASNIRLHIDSDVAYLVMPKARSHEAGYLYLSNNSTGSNIPWVKPNGSILTQFTTIKHVMTSAAEAEPAQIYKKKGGHPYLPHPSWNEPRPTWTNPVKTDNKTSEGFAKSTTRQKHSKSWDM